jgi:SAM-dependent methyltransferase
LEAPRGARVLEIGYGSAGLTELLVRAGLDVTGIELRESNGRFARRRVQGFGLDFKTITGDLGSVQLNGLFDRIIFFESFNHVPNFHRVLPQLVERRSPGGAIYFGAKPIVADGDPIIPYPWGVRLDGGALSAGRDVGWLEVGFQRAFMYQMLNRLGLSVSERSLPNYHHSYMIIARKPL